MPGAEKDAAPAVETDAAKPPLPVFPHADACKKAEEVAAKAHMELNAKALPVRQYLEHTVVPLLMQGMQQLVKERPEDPVQYLAAYLIKHNPKDKVEDVEKP